MRLEKVRAGLYRVETESGEYRIKRTSWGVSNYWTTTVFDLSGQKMEELPAAQTLKAAREQLIERKATK